MKPNTGGVVLACLYFRFRPDVFPKFVRYFTTFVRCSSEDAIQLNQFLFWHIANLVASVPGQQIQKCEHLKLVDTIKVSVITDIVEISVTNFAYKHFLQILQNIEFTYAKFLLWEMDDLRFRKIFNLGITKDIFGKKLSKLEKLQSLVAPEML